MAGIRVPAEHEVPGATGATGAYYKDASLAATQQEVATSSTTVIMVQVDNTANTSQDVWAKFYDANSAVTVGTTEPEMIIKAPAGKKVTISSGKGIAFANGLRMACVTSGGAAGTGAPASAVPVKVYTK